MTRCAASAQKYGKAGARKFPEPCFIFVCNVKKIQFSKDADANMKAMISKPYAKVLKEAFPQATFVGFTGTPIAETYQTFGDEIDRYTMDQAVADGLTVPIKYHPRIAKVLLDKEKIKQIEAYYKLCADECS